MPRPASLSLAMPRAVSPISSAVTSSSSSGPPSASARSEGDYAAENKENIPVKTSEKCPELQIHFAQDPDGPLSPTLTSLPPFPPSPTSTKHVRDPSKSFFANLKASKSSNRVNQLEPTIRYIPEESFGDHSPSRSRSTFYSVRKGSGSTPDLSKSTFGGDSSSFVSLDPSQIVERRPTGPSTSSESVLAKTPTESLRKSKPRFVHLLNRTRSTRTEEGGRKAKAVTPIRVNGPAELRNFDGSSDTGGLKTAPLQQDKMFREMMGSAVRNKSADRQPAVQNEHGEPVRGPNAAVPREGVSARSHLMTNIKNTSTRAADGLGKARKGIFGKITRSGSSTGKEGMDDEPYVCSTINLPLVEQTRRTRIAKRLEDSKDKTEFWLPALPWRCIDYLNFRGCEEEGLYRVPGSGLQIREWQRRFDREGDINLFDEDELYDINIIGSMFKAWLRDLPTEILPKATQARIARECAGATEVPEMLKNELSLLPPWNYYLLFAITCHLSLLHAYVDKNKMNYTNLCICFQPCLGIDSFCFQFLVREWRHCWQGCWTEKEFLDIEYGILNLKVRDDGAGGENHAPDQAQDSDGVYSITADQTPSSAATSTGSIDRSRPPLLSLGPDNNSASGENYAPRLAHGPSSIDSWTTDDQTTFSAATSTVSLDRSRPPPLSLETTTPDASPRRPQYPERGSSRIPELAPVKPLSPIGL